VGRRGATSSHVKNLTAQTWWSTRGWSLGIDPTALTATHSSFIEVPSTSVRVCVFIPLGQWVRNKHGVMFRKFARCQYQLDVRQLQCLVEFVKVLYWEQSLLSTNYQSAQENCTATACACSIY